MNCVAITHAGAWIWTLLSSAGFREWCVVLAELVVAGVIYGELEENRIVAFLAKATDFKTNQERRKIYTAYFDLPMTCNTVDAASAAFNEHALKDEGIKKACDKEIALFNELGLVSGKRRWWGWRRPNRLVKILPHAAVYVWVFCRHRIALRRSNTGPWFAKPLLEFTLESVKYVLTFNQSLWLRPESDEIEKRTLEISVRDLHRIRCELEEELSKKA